MKTIFSYKDLGLASYLLVNGNEFKGVEIKYSKRFNEFKIYVKIEGLKEQLIKMKDYYEQNKIQINKTKSIQDMLVVLSDRVERILKKEEVDITQS
jgi:hypothetical protein